MIAYIVSFPLREAILSVKIKLATVIIGRGNVNHCLPETKSFPICNHSNLVANFVADTMYRYFCTHNLLDFISQASISSTSTLEYSRLHPFHQPTNVMPSILAVPDCCQLPSRYIYIYNLLCRIQLAPLHALCKPSNFWTRESFYLIFLTQYSPGCCTIWLSYLHKIHSPCLQCIPWAPFAVEKTFFCVAVLRYDR